MTGVDTRRARAGAHALALLGSAVALAALTPLQPVAALGEVLATYTAAGSTATVALANPLITSALAHLWGAGGGSVAAAPPNSPYSTAGGAGAYVTGYVDVTRTTTVTVGAGGTGAGVGGQSSYITVAGVRVLIAAGGGSGGAPTNGLGGGGDGGCGGCNSGVAGQCVEGGCGAAGGGTTSGGGVGGYYLGNGGAHIACPGGSRYVGGCCAGNNAGCGGDGVYGGGSGQRWAGGGGGASLWTMNCVQSGDGTTAPGTSDPAFPGGQYGASARQGVVVLTFVCPFGCYCSDHSLASLKQCEAGYFCPTRDATLPQSCTAGYSCPSAGMTAVGAQCPAAHFCPSQTANPLPCLPGFACPTAGASTPTLACPGGTYCPAGSSAPYGCPIGSYCPPVSGAPVPCPNGFYCATANATEPTAQCPGGSYCANGLPPVPCPPGTFCPPGASGPTPCLDGEYCVGGTANAVPCVYGSYCVAGATAAALCPAGTYGNAVRLNTSACSGTCPAGHYCPAGSIYPAATPCADGRYGAVAGLSDALCSGPCAPGYYCLPGATTATQFPCGSPSQYCPGQSASPLTAPRGWYTTPSAGPGSDEATRTGVAQCVPGAACVGGQLTTCPAGRYANDTGMTACLSCPAGRTSAAPNQTAAAGEEAGATACVDCAPGTFTATDAAVCAACPAGQYAAEARSTHCQDCAPGSASFSAAQPNCTLCSAGAYQDRLAQSRCLPCPAGAYSSDANATACSGCTPGRYSGGAFATACDACAAGRYAASPHAVACPPCAFVVSGNGSACDTGQCPAGWAAAPGGEGGCVECGPGQYALANATACSQCVVNSYNVVSGATACALCDDAWGVTCPGGSQVLTDRGVWVWYDPGSGAMRTASCPETYCVGSDGVQHTQCGPNREQSAGNALCGRCATGYTEQGDACVDCDNGWQWLTIPLLLALLWAAVLGVAVVSQSPSGLAGVVFYFLQIALVTAGPTSGWLGWISFLNFSPAATSGITHGLCVLPLQPTELALLRLWFPFVAAAMLGVTAVLHRTCLRDGRRCGCCACCCRACERFAIPRFHMALYYRAACGLALYSYTQIAGTAIAVLQCTTVGAGPVAAPQQAATLVASQPSIDCGAPQYEPLRATAIALLALYVCLLPAAICALYWRHRRAFTTGPRVPAPGATPIIGSAAPINAAERDAKEPADGGDAVGSGPAAVSAAIPIAQRQILARWSVLFAPFARAHGAWTQLWQVFVLARRVAVAVVALQPSASDRFLGLAITAAISLCLSLTLRPYDTDPRTASPSNRLCNEFDAASQFVLLLLAVTLWNAGSAAGGSVTASTPTPTGAQVAVTLLVAVPLTIGVSLLTYRLVLRLCGTRGGSASATAAPTASAKTVAGDAVGVVEAQRDVGALRAASLFDSRSTCDDDTRSVRSSAASLAASPEPPSAVSGGMVALQMRLLDTRDAREDSAH